MNKTEILQSVKRFAQINQCLVYKNVFFQGLRGAVLWHWCISKNDWF